MFHWNKEPFSLQNEEIILIDTQHHLGAFPLPCFQSLEGGLRIVEAVAAIDERAQLAPVLPHELRTSRVVVDAVAHTHQVLPPQGKL